MARTAMPVAPMKTSASESAKRSPVQTPRSSKLSSPTSSARRFVVVSVNSSPMRGELSAMFTARFCIVSYPRRVNAMNATFI